VRGSKINSTVKGSSNSIRTNSRPQTALSLNLQTYRPQNNKFISIEKKE